MSISGVDRGKSRLQTASGRKQMAFGNRHGAETLGKDPLAIQ